MLWFPAAVVLWRVLETRLARPLAGLPPQHTGHAAAVADR